MSDLISRSATIESIKAEIQCVEKEKQQYFEQGNFHNGNILVEKIQAMKLVMKIVANEPTLCEIPQKAVGFGTDNQYVRGRKDGWNQCIDKMLGGDS